MALLETAHVQTQFIVPVRDNTCPDTVYCPCERQHMSRHSLMSLLETAHVQTQFNVPVRDSTCPDTV